MITKIERTFDKSKNGGGKMSESTYIAIDLKSFYASVECMERGLDPLTTNLVVADISRTEKTICLAVSPSLKVYGIGGRARLFEVNQRLREVQQQTGKVVEYIAAPPQMARYIQVSSEIYEVYLRFVSPEDIHVYSIDECFLDVTNYLQLYQMTVEELAERMIQEVFEKTGITATAGIGSNLYLCKIAMDIMAKHVAPSATGARIAKLTEETYRLHLWEHKPLTDFWRIGSGTAKRLESIGIYTMGDIARASLTNRETFYKIFGVDGELLIDHAWGYEPCTMRDIKNYRPSTNSLSTGQVLHTPYDYKKARIIVKEMTELLVLDLVDSDRMTDSVTLSVGYERITDASQVTQVPISKDRYGREIPKSAHGTANLGTASSSTKKITDEVLALYDRMVDQQLLIRRIQMSANHLVREGYEQFDLFTDHAAMEKEKKLQKAMLSIKGKYGKNAILKGYDLEEGATTMERNKQIGGHKA